MDFFRLTLSFFGYYAIKARWRKWHNRRAIIKRDAKRVDALQAEIAGINIRVLPEIRQIGNVTVSLTSYGKRVSENAAYAVLSILHQSVLPNRIVLNLDETKWNGDNLPIEIKRLMVAGLEVNFCEDTGPHTKLLPTLQKYPDDIVVTIDDDILYEKTMLEDLLRGYKETEGNCIVCREARIIEKDANGDYVRYTQGHNAEYGTTRVGYMPYGYKGVLYPPHIFSEVIYNKKIYREICRHADDIWFGVVEYIEKIPVYCIKSTEMSLNFVNTIEQWEPTADTCLYYENTIQGKNDIQYQAVLKYFGL